MSAGEPKVAVLIPCLNEEQTIAFVVEAFRRQLPEATVWVFDNGSTDRTVEEARRAGALVGFELRRGKGYTLRTAFNEVDADIYVMVDGDGTYPPDRVHALIAPVREGRADMVIGSRLLDRSHPGFKWPNLVGNLIFRGLHNAFFRARITDLLSGYRAVNRRVAKGLPYLSRGFEIEPELTVKCLERDLRVVEVPVTLSHRPRGSHSKIHIVRDTVRIIDMILALVRDYKPLTAFGSVGLMFIAIGLIPGFIVIKEYLETGLVPRLPSVVLAVGLVLTGLLLGFVGLVLHTIARRFQELDRQLQNLLEGRPDRAQSSPNTRSQT